MFSMLCTWATNAGATSCRSEPEQDLPLELPDDEAHRQQNPTPEGEFCYGGKATRGAISWFDGHKGFGFLKSEFGGADMFIHGNDVAPDAHPLMSGDRVVFKIQMNRGKMKAVQLAMGWGTTHRPHHQ